MSPRWCRLNPIVPTVLQDADDDPVIATALAGKAEVLCTLDAHFYVESVRRFCGRNGITIMDDREILRVLRSLR